MKTIRTMMILDMKQRVLLTIILLIVFCSYSFALIGGAGTKYDPNHIDGTYAHIDGGSSKPGYLSPKVYDVWVAGKQVNIINMSDVLGDGGQRISHPVKGRIYIQNGRKVRF